MLERARQRRKHSQHDMPESHVQSTYKPHAIADDKPSQNENLCAPSSAVRLLLLARASQLACRTDCGNPDCVQRKEASLCSVAHRWVAWCAGPVLRQCSWEELQCNKGVLRRCTPLDGTARMDCDQIPAGKDSDRGYCHPGNGQAGRRLNATREHLADAACDGSQVHEHHHACMWASLHLAQMQCMHTSQLLVQGLHVSDHVAQV